jgi:hypothetical protein
MLPHRSRGPSMPQVPGLDTGRRPPEAAQVTDSGVQARLLTGRIARGRLMGTRVLLKVPIRRVNGTTLDVVAIWGRNSQHDVHSVCHGNGLVDTSVMSAM